MNMELGTIENLRVIVVCKKVVGMVLVMHVKTIQWTYDNLIKTDYCSDLVLFLDSDMFLLDNFSMVDYMKDEIISGLKQVRGNIEYMWNGIMFFNMPKIMEIDPDLNFF